MTRFVSLFSPASTGRGRSLRRGASGRRDGFAAAVAAGMAFLAAAPAAGQVLRYGGDPGTARTYLREQSDRVVQTVNARQLATEIRGTWRLEAAVAGAAADSLTLRVVHDSLAISEGGAPVQPDLSELYGIPVTILMDRRGQVADVVVPDSLPAAAARLDLGSTYRAFFPRLPEGEAAAGAAWADTTAATAVQAGLELRVTRVNRYRSQGWAQSAGRRMVRVEYETELSIEGSGEQEESGIVLGGTGRGTGGYSFDPEAGAFISGGETVEMRMVALVAAQGGNNILVPIVQNRSLTITSVDRP